MAVSRRTNLTLFLSSFSLLLSLVCEFILWPFFYLSFLSPFLSFLLFIFLSSHYFARLHFCLYSFPLIFFRFLYFSLQVPFLFLTFSCLLFSLIFFSFSVILYFYHSRFLCNFLVDSASKAIPFKYIYVFFSLGLSPWLSKGKKNLVKVSRDRKFGCLPQDRSRPRDIRDNKAGWYTRRMGRRQRLDDTFCCSTNTEQRQASVSPSVRGCSTQKWDDSVDWLLLLLYLDRLGVKE